LIDHKILDLKQKIDLKIKQLHQTMASQMSKTLPMP